jgi:outer membrane protein assembly factor BamD
MRRLFGSVLVVSIGLFLVYACAPKTPDEFDNEKQLYEYGLKLYNEGKYSEAITFFETFKNKYPTSQLIADAEFNLAESYFKKGDWLEAIFAYQNFRTLHPTNPRVPSALLRIAQSYYKQMPGSIDRDQTNTTNCINTIDELSARYPGSEEAKESAKMLAKCKRMLAERELYIANFYLKQKSYSAALGRLESLKQLDQFKDLKEEALYKLAFSYHKLKDRDKSIENLNELLGMDPGENYRRKANELLAKLSTRGQN